MAKTHGFADGKLQRCLKTEVVLPVEWAADLWQETGVTIYRVDLDCLRRRAMLRMRQSSSSCGTRRYEISTCLMFKWRRHGLAAESESAFAQASVADEPSRSYGHRAASSGRHRRSPSRKDSNAKSPTNLITSEVSRLCIQLLKNLGTAGITALCQ